MKIEIKKWKNVEDYVLKQYERKGLANTLEFCTMTGTNLMAGLYFITKKYPNDEKACEKLKDLLEWYGATFEEES